jgi:hypothetical protein
MRRSRRSAPLPIYAGSCEPLNSAVADSHCHSAAIIAATISSDRCGLFRLAACALAPDGRLVLEIAAGLVFPDSTASARKWT